ncbi:enhancer of rudimentary homolog [Teleopsis dalmanni]|uniref:enhancer of rudimentary homolog n=1 Tax=Teleopsis dalmanni TaxID=139649 RepID=UPI0018CFADF5|nr:enhancer of rudimentary homolog [Teleopsis dalmanni]XP_037928022.1 enhancer of rudimentary homolog [Teleopsis dalmanni]
MALVILLVDPFNFQSGRTFLDYETMDACIEGICRMYEQHLVRLFPTTEVFTYDLRDLFKFMDGFRDFAVLLRVGTDTFSPHNKEWIKDEIVAYMRLNAQPTGTSAVKTPKNE